MTTENKNPYIGKAFTLSEAKKIPGQFIYGLTDKSQEMFYVGKTVDGHRRFHDHKRQMQNHHFLRRLKEAGEDVRVVVLDYNPTDLDLAEVAAIVGRAQSITNLKHNPYRTPKGIHVPVDARHDLMGQCPGCDKPMDRPRYKYCSACTTKHLRRSSQNKSDASDLAAIAAAHRARQAG